MKVFNRGARAYTYPGGIIPPGGVSAEITDRKQIEHVKAMLIRYKHDLVDAEGRSGGNTDETVALKATIRALKSRIAELESQLGNRDRLKETEPKTPDLPAAPESAPAEPPAPASAGEESQLPKDKRG